MQEKLLTLVREQPVSVVMGMVGLVLMVLGLRQMEGVGRSEAVRVVMIEDGPGAGETVVVDVAGGVERPGVFRLDAGARVADALMAAGGLAAQADRGWVARFVNQAEVVKDGMKIFIPLEGVEAQGGDAGAGSLGAEVAGARSVNVNSASMEELDSLWGIGEARARAIVDNRPYQSLEELVSKAGIPANVLEKNENKLSIY